MEYSKLNKIKEAIRSRIYTNDHFRLQWKKDNPFAGTDKEWAYNAGTYFTLGIVYDPAHYHSYYIAACIDLQISYKVVDILKDNWIEEINNSDCAGFMIWPHINSQVLKEILDERTYLMSRYLSKSVYPDPESIALLDNKRRVRDWLLVNNFSPPKTWCFSEKSEAIQFINNTTYPIVFKTIKGSVSRGVEIIRNKKRALQLVNVCFGAGMHPYRMDRRNNQWDFILFQEYLENCEEKRLIRIGESYFSIEKIRGTSNYHSGSGLMKWSEMNEYYLNKTKELTDLGNFSCMNVDFLIDKDGKDYINELHPLFHGPRILDKTNQGRYLFDKKIKTWEFEEGNYYRNYTTNCRVLDFIKKLGLDYVDDKNWLSKDVFYEINGRRM